MSYIPRKYTLNAIIKEDTSWRSNDADYVNDKLKSLKYELEKVLGDKFEEDYKDILEIKNK